jgi:hypothetical protein
MQIDKVLFVFLLSKEDPELIDHLDRITCKCHYIRHWVFNMARGTWNPELTEMDYELKGIIRPEELYDFLIKKYVI